MMNLFCGRRTRSQTCVIRTTALLAATVVIGDIRAAHAQSGANASSKATATTFAPIKLRGYGLVSGTATVAADGSVLRIETESAEKAQLLQSKYLSDFGLLPLVTHSDLSVGSVKVAVHEAKGQGLVAALRDGKTVYIVSAPDQSRLVSLMRSVPVSALAASRAAVPVPMYLDRWDKFNFRHYYRAWERPADTTDSNYDFVHEFDWAKQQDSAGFVFWDDTLKADTSEGMFNYGWWDWAADEAAKRSLPVGINFAGEPTWFLNEFRDQVQRKMPGFSGNHHYLASPGLGGEGVLAWSTTTAEDARLGLLQQSALRFAAQPNVTTFLEPHGELKHGNQDIFLEYGPAVDDAYRKYLRARYKTIDVLTSRWRRDLKAWGDVHIPELASFEGWGADALDLGGSWHIGYETLKGEMPRAWQPDMSNQAPSEPAPAQWFQPGFDDSTWPTITEPGNDQMMLTVKRPAVFRRTFDVTPEWKASHAHVYFYLWDMNTTSESTIRAVLNGKEVGTSKSHRNVPHWMGVDVTDVLRPGKNDLAIRLPQGYIAYKTYLSSIAPHQYPNLGEGLNAQWVDFTDFTQWSRVDDVRRGMEMIRQAAPDHQIVLMSPTAYGDGVKGLAKRYGGELHDTGAMAGFWDEYPSTLSRGADLPTSVEPGGPAKDLIEWRSFWGRWQTEGVQAVDYFIHLGNVLWNPEIKADYEAHRKQIALMGQSHLPKAETGILYSDRILQLTGVPWGFDPNAGMAGGYWAWNAASVLHGTFPADGLTQSSFANGEADGYRFVIDTNTSIMDTSMVADIEKWVRAGGTFVTLAQTGRSTPERPDSWPISSLTGYKVTKIDRLTAKGGVDESGTLQAASEQKIYSADWNGVRANGLHLEKVAPEAQNLLMWNDGTVAAGVRRLGKGYVVQLGAKFTGDSIPDRIEHGSNNTDAQHLRSLLTTLLDWRQVHREPFRLAVPNDNIWVRPEVTNNGLYDTWVVWNSSRDSSATVSLILEKGRTPEFAIEARTGQTQPTVATPEGTQIQNIALEPAETRVFLTPRAQISQAPLAWFDLQRKWWRGTAQPASKTLLPPPPHSDTLDLTEGWKFKGVTSDADVARSTAADCDDSAWASHRLHIWDTKDEGKHAVLRRQFTVPAQWKSGQIRLWVTGTVPTSFENNGRVYLDGVQIKADGKTGVLGLESASLKPGTSHVLAVDAAGDGVLAGLRGQSWLAFEPTPGASLDLNGTWQPSRDALTFDPSVTVPGKFEAQMLQRTAFVDEKYRDKRVMVTVDGDSSFVGVIVNGILVRRDNSLTGHWSLNITPYVRFGAQNTFVVFTNNSVIGKQLKDVRLGFYPK